MNRIRQNPKNENHGNHSVAPCARKSSGNRAGSPDELNGQPLFLMPKDSGWILVYRKIEEHPFYSEKREFSKLEAWLDILLQCNFEEKEVVLKNTLIKCGRGQSIRSLGSWQDRWNWKSKKRVVAFFKLLTNMGQIKVENIKITTLITVCNYDRYQKPGNATETRRKRDGN